LCCGATRKRVVFPFGLHSRRYSARRSAHAVVSAPPHLVKNRILGQLSADELKSVQPPWLTPVQLQSNTVLHEPGKTIEQVYFPLSGMISLLAVMRSGEHIEIGSVGARGTAKTAPEPCA
jgi:hypothetical protein